MFEHFSQAIGRQNPLGKLENWLYGQTGGLEPRIIEFLEQANTIVGRYFPRAVRSVIESLVALKLAELARQKPMVAAAIAAVSPELCHFAIGRFADWLADHILDITGFEPATDGPFDANDTRWLRNNNIG